MNEVTHSSFFLTVFWLLWIVSLFLSKANPSIFAPDLISSHPLKDFASILFLIRSSASAFLLLHHLSKQVNTKTQQTPPLNQHISFLLYPSISLLVFMGKLTLRVVYSCCLLISSHYHFIQIALFCLPLHWDNSQIHISGTDLFLEFHTYIYNYLQTISTWLSIRYFKPNSLKQSG